MTLRITYILLVLLLGSFGWAAAQDVTGPVTETATRTEVGIESTLTLSLFDDADGSGTFTPGDIVQVQGSIDNIGRQDLYDVQPEVAWYVAEDLTEVPVDGTFFEDKIPENGYRLLASTTGSLVELPIYRGRINAAASISPFYPQDNPAYLRGTFALDIFYRNENMAIDNYPELFTHRVYFAIDYPMLSFVAMSHTLVEDRDGNGLITPGDIVEISVDVTNNAAPLTTANDPYTVGFDLSPAADAVLISGSITSTLGTPGLQSLEYTNFPAGAVDTFTYRVGILESLPGTYVSARHRLFEQTSAGPIDRDSISITIPVESDDVQLVVDDISITVLEDRDNSGTPTYVDSFRVDATFTNTNVFPAENVRVLLVPNPESYRIIDSDSGNGLPQTSEEAFPVAEFLFESIAPETSESVSMVLELTPGLFAERSVGARILLLPATNGQAYAVESTRLDFPQISLGELTPTLDYTLTNDTDNSGSPTPGDSFRLDLTLLNESSGIYFPRGDQLFLQADTPRPIQGVSTGSLFENDTNGGLRLTDELLPGESVLYSHEVTLQPFYPYRSVDFEAHGLPNTSLPAAEIGEQFSEIINVPLDIPPAQEVHETLTATWALSDDVNGDGLVNPGDSVDIMLSVNNPRDWHNPRFDLWGEATNGETQLLAVGGRPPAEITVFDGSYLAAGNNVFAGPVWTRAYLDGLEPLQAVALTYTKRISSTTLSDVTETYGIQNIDRRGNFIRVTESLVIPIGPPELQVFTPEEFSAFSPVNPTTPVDPAQLDDSASIQPLDGTWTIQLDPDSVTLSDGCNAQAQMMVGFITRPRSEQATWSTPPTPEDFERNFATGPIRPISSSGDLQSGFSTSMEDPEGMVINTTYDITGPGTITGTQEYRPTNMFGSGCVITADYTLTHGG